MKLRFKLSFILFILLAGCHNSHQPDLQELFYNPPEEAKPWVYWYWVKAAVSREGITADLEAMKRTGIGGAYLFFIKESDDPPLYNPPIEQLTPEWWDMVNFACNEAERLGLKLGFHSCDGFTTAGGPWITPEMSMQKIVWSELQIKGDQIFSDTLPLPEINEGYYRDLAVFAYHTPDGAELSTNSVIPKVTTSIGNVPVQYLCDPDNEKVFRSSEPCWIQYEFDKPFLCRQIYIRKSGRNYQSHRLLVESSDDGIHFDSVCRLEYPRHGWQDFEADITHAIPPTKAKFFRFVYNTEGSEPGAEDLDAARWNSALRIRRITLSGKPVIHQYEGKNGSIWRISKNTAQYQVPDSLCIPLDKILDLSEHFDSTGTLLWNTPPGKWTILRIGHTSTGHTNYIGGGGKGLECDKFDPEIVKYQFGQWFGRVFDSVEVAPEVLKIFHVDSWECGSQNWSPVFREEFKKRRGYDLYNYLPIIAGLPVENIETSERFLYDIRETISELITDNFFKTMHELAKKKGCQFSAESIAPVMTSDGMLHFSQVDIPMGEFWLNSPTHDKPMDILDAISAAHIYNKPVVQAEAFTTLRMDWNEYPGMLKTLGDRNFTFGINRLVFHVFTHNPWMDRQPGMTLNGVGLYFQRNQTWWDALKEWISYLQRCQAILQQGQAVNDIAIFTSEEIPRRSITPERLTGILPGLLGEDFIQQEKLRLENNGVPMHEKPKGVKNSKNTFDIYQWPDPLRGYKYDSFNRDALLRLAKVKDGSVILPGGTSYKVLVFPGPRKMDPNFSMSLETVKKIKELIEDGATVIIGDIPEKILSMTSATEENGQLQTILSKMLDGEFKNISTEQGIIQYKDIGKGRIIVGPYIAETLDRIGIPRDFIAYEHNGDLSSEISWTHRRIGNEEIYFISNQSQTSKVITISLRAIGKYPEIFNPVTNEIYKANTWEVKDGRTEIPVKMDPDGSLFIVLREHVKITKENSGINWIETTIAQEVTGSWEVKFNIEKGGPSHPVIFTELEDWTTSNNDSIKYYSGSAIYSKTINFDKPTDQEHRYWIDLGKVNCIAGIIVNGTDCGIAWTFPFRREITDAVIQGENSIEINVTNTWHNRIIGDNNLPEEDRITWTTAPFRLNGEHLTSAGLLGPVIILTNNLD